MSHGRSSQTSWSLEQTLSTPSTKTADLSDCCFAPVPCGNLHHTTFSFSSFVHYPLPSSVFAWLTAVLSAAGKAMPVLPPFAGHSDAAQVGAASYSSNTASIVCLVWFSGFKDSCPLLTLFLHVWLFQIGFFLRWTVVTSWISRKHPKIWYIIYFVVLVSCGTYRCSLTNMSLCPSVNCPFYSLHFLRFYFTVRK